MGVVVFYFIKMLCMSKKSSIFAAKFQYWELFMYNKQFKV